jgi:hypothetical protein
VLCLRLIFSAKHLSYLEIPEGEQEVAIIKSCIIYGSTDLSEKMDIIKPVLGWFTVALIVRLIKIFTVEAPVKKNNFKLVKHWAQEH